VIDVPSPTQIYHTPESYISTALDLKSFVTHDANMGYPAFDVLGESGQIW
jgi:hypothetical protein